MNEDSDSNKINYENSKNSENSECGVRETNPCFTLLLGEATVNIKRA